MKTIIIIFSAILISFVSFGVMKSHVENRDLEVQKELSHAIDDSIILDDKLRAGYNDLILAKAEYVISIKLAKGEISEAQANLYRSDVKTMIQLAKQGDMVSVKR